MCTPAAALGGAAGLAGLSALGAYQGQTAQNKSLKAQARLAEANAALADEAAHEALRQGKRMETGIQRAMVETQAAGRSIGAGGNIDVLAGSMLQLYDEAIVAAEADTHEARYRTWLENRAQRAQAASLRYQAKMLRRAQGSPGLAFAGSLLGGASSVLGLYAGFKSAKMIG
jgi:hypothetical protein